MFLMLNPPSPTCQVPVTFSRARRNWFLGGNLNGSILPLQQPNPGSLISKGVEVWGVLVIHPFLQTPWKFLSCFWETPKGCSYLSVVSYLSVFLEH